MTSPETEGSSKESPLEDQERVPEGGAEEQPGDTEPTGQEYTESREDEPIPKDVRARIALTGALLFELAHVMPIPVVRPFGGDVSKGIREKGVLGGLLDRARQIYGGSGRVNDLLKSKNWDDLLGDQNPQTK
jgi:hypothetical protein